MSSIDICQTKTYVAVTFGRLTEGWVPAFAGMGQNGSMQRYDAIVIGGGLVGSAIAYGLAREGLKTALIDEGDVAFRASRGNFGLVWVQSKGLGAPHYQRWTRLSAEEWPKLAAELGERTGIAVGLEQPGGVQLCLGEEEFSERRAMMGQMQREAGNLALEDP